jgi:hypothetical protein
MMVPPAPSGKPVDLLRLSSEQIRRAAEILSEIAGETELPSLQSRGQAPLQEDPALRLEHTIRTAQRLVAAELRLAQLEERPEEEHP